MPALLASGSTVQPLRWPRFTRGRHRPKRADPPAPKPAFSFRPSDIYPLPLVETWETARTWGTRP